MRRVLAGISCGVLLGLIPCGEPIWGQEQRGEPEPTSSPLAADRDAVVILGRPQDVPYVVVIPGREESLLDRVQAQVPEAFLTDSRRGRYVHAGAFSAYSDAAILSDRLRDEGFDARVVYFRAR